MAHYFEYDANLASNIKLKNAKIQARDLQFYTDNGVFSKKGLDFGTRTLLESLPVNLRGDILDFGTGYGAIGIYLAKTTTNSSVDMLDINDRALELAHKNAELNKVNVNIFKSNLYTNVSKKYDYIITNPPIRVGKVLLYEILLGAKNYLKEKGELWLVINKEQGAKTLIKELEKHYITEIVSKSKGFFVVSCKND